MEFENDQIRSAYRLACGMCAIVLFTGYFAFGGVLWSVQKWNRIYWVVSLAVSDILIGIHLLASDTFVFNHDSLIHGEIGCHASAFLSLGFGFVSLLNTAMVAWDRYNKVCHSEKGLVSALVADTLCTVSNLVSALVADDCSYRHLVAFIWVLGLLLAALPAIGVGKYDRFNKNSVVCLVDLKAAENQYFVLAVAFLCFTLPLYVISTSYSKLAQVDKQYKKMALFIPSLLLVCYGPYALYAVTQITLGVSLHPLLVMLAHVFPKFLSAVNPHLYLKIDPEIKQALNSVPPENVEKKKE